MNVRFGDHIKLADGRHFIVAAQQPQDGSGRIAVQNISGFGFVQYVDGAGAVIIKRNMVAWVPRASVLRSVEKTAEEWFEGYKERALNDDDFCLSGSLTVGTYRAGRQNPDYVATWVMMLWEAGQSAVVSERLIPVTI